MSSSADEIERQAEHAIYRDDPDALERLRERIAELEAKREQMKARNAAYRKAHAAELRELTPYGRNQAVPHPSYELQNLGGNISRLRKRLELVPVQQANAARDRVITARYAGKCADCGAELERGQTIRYSKQAGARCETPCAGGDAA
jgi:DNA repair exonuclease SbcCD ATPase subunit